MQRGSCLFGLHRGESADGVLSGGWSVPGTAYSELTVRLVEKDTVGVLLCLSFCLRRYINSSTNSSTTRRTSTTMPPMAPHESPSPGGRGTMTLPTCSSEPDQTGGESRARVRPVTLPVSLQCRIKVLTTILDATM